MCWSSSSENHPELGSGVLVLAIRPFYPQKESRWGSCPLLARLGQRLVDRLGQLSLLDSPVRVLDTVDQDHRDELTVELLPQWVVVEMDFFDRNIQRVGGDVIDDRFGLVTQVTVGLSNHGDGYGHPDTL